MFVAKLIKRTDWTTNDGRKGATLVVAYKGYAFVINPEDFVNIALVDVFKKDAKGASTADVDYVLVKIDEEVAYDKESYTDGLGVTKTGLRLKPKFDLDLNGVL